MVTHNADPVSVQASRDSLPTEPAECTHEHLIECVRTLSNGATAWGTQCKRCGCWNARKKSDFATEPTTTYESAIRDEWEAEQRMFWQGMSAHFQHEHEQKREDDHSAWLIEYNDYLASDVWAKRREAILKRDEGLCQGCLRRPATQVHHLTYAHWKNELAFELLSLCKLCHEKVHGKELKGAA
ncbi:MAG: hypothetical protein WC563_15330 [Brevundimonas sp.]